jgi:hypothetical protein
MEHQPSKAETHLLLLQNHDDEENNHVQEFCHMQQHEHEEEGQGLRGLPDLEDGEDNEVDDDDDDEDDDIDGPRPLDSDDAKGVESTTSDRALQALAVTQIAVASTSANDDGKGMKHDDDHHNMAVTPVAAAGQVLPRGQGRELLDVLREVDDIFLKAVESSDAVSKFLETRKLPSTYSDGLKGKVTDLLLLHLLLLHGLLLHQKVASISACASGFFLLLFDDALCISFWI